MSIELIIAIIQALAALAPQVPEVLALVESATSIIKAGTVTPEAEATLRGQLDQVKALIDAA